MNLPSIELLRQGDSEGWDVVFEWLWPMALSSARRKLEVLAPADVEDAALDAFVALFQTIDNVPSTESLPSLIVAIASNRAIDVLRSRSAQKRDASLSRTFDVVLEDETLGTQVNPLEALQIQELYELLEQVRLDLPPFTARILHEYYYEGQSQREIAERHRVTVSSISGRIRRGLLILHNKLKNNRIFCEDYPDKIRIV
jgi:RNA polymerase sigma factor (sigma-70 family)